MKYAILSVFLLLDFCHEEPSNCNAVKAGEQWLSKKPTNLVELRKEVDAVLIDNRCDGITPTKLHKIFADFINLEEAKEARGLNSAFEKKQ